ncbi:MAG TPA: PEP-CTERM sorting domain-containing protein [Chthoniobacteraceae bacterium]|nr:PEP-CTERM sorting domain-containing protein [Chthoniobacteraceae bacterium]
MILHPPAASTIPTPIKKMTANPLSRQFHLTLIALGGLTCSSLAQTQNNWAGGNGENLNWNLDANWSQEAVPVDPTYYAHFLSGTSAKINVAAGTSTARMTLDGNTSVELVIAPKINADPSFTTPGLLRVGYSGTGASHLTFSGLGEVALGTFQVGARNTTPGGNTLTVTGGVTFNSVSDTGISTVGRFGYNNHLLIEDESTARIGILTVGNDGGVANNHVTVQDEGTSLTIDGWDGSRGLRIGVNTSTTDYATGSQKNYVEIKDGGKITVTSKGGGSSNLIYVGTAANAHNNYLTITGEGSTLELGKGTATSGGTAITIGNTEGTNLGGNYVEIRDGGKLVSLAGHTGGITIHNHLQTGQHDGRNRLTVGDGGSVEIGGNVNVTGGLLQLASTGALKANRVAVSAGGRFEAGGADLETPGGTEIGTGSTLAIGLSGASTASLLTLKSAVAMEAGSALELGLFADGTMSGIALDEGGSFSINSSATIRLVLSEGYQPVSGSEWTVFTGELGSITGTFDLNAATLPELAGDLEWDLTRFNQAGAWTVAVIPEPGSVALLLLAGGAWLAGGRLFARRQG